MPLAGGHSEPKPATEEIQAKVESIKSDIEARYDGSSQNNETFQVVEFRRQVVAGTVYHFKIDIGNEKCLMAKVFEPLPHTKQPMEVQNVVCKPLNEPLVTLATKRT
eukprot:CAMPEP_0194047344 /NCGR_PEP_ID=MMETSP0009_2-20130614/24104_1 /TAXON_ID=210454 /ORGANISM="Grammatophora oceanica, Strain CCMP 410" /LENGTH=106 /DNA_ID=CAMNT_0038692929 /DNA_START=17 /DNA_END=337 /DNA_ORIENTATION=+